MNRIAPFALAALMTVHVGCSRQRIHVDGDNLLVLEGATLVPGNGLSIVDDAVVVVRGDRIEQIGRSGDFTYTADAAVHDLSGKYLVPGYFDTHIHLTEQEMMDRVLRLLVANGITTVRAAAGLADANVALRDEVSSGVRLGPRIKTAGMPIDEPDGPESWMPKVGTADEMRSEVRRQADAGVDFIKLYRTVRPELARVAVEEAHSRGLRVIGHLNETTWEQAAMIGMDGVVHSGIYSPMWELLPEDQWDTIRATFNAFGKDGVDGFRILAEGVDIESESFTRWTAILAAHDLPVEPNLVMQKAAFWGDDEALYRSFEPESAPASWHGTYRLAFPRSTVAQVTPEWMTEGRSIYPILEDMAVAFFRSGVTVTAGTDMMLPWMTPGTSLHRELQLLAEAGLNPAEVLQVATINGAKAMGLEEDLGTIEVGKLADITVLNADPLESAYNLRDIHLVVLRGRVQTPSELLE